MPELPEVEVMATRLNTACMGWDIESHSVLRQPRRPRYSIAFAEGERIYSVYRYGKQLLFDLGKGGWMVCHNAMSGYWDLQDEPWTFDYVEGKREANDRDVRVEITLRERTRKRVLRFHDARMFGSLKHVDGHALFSSLRKVGPDAISTPRMFPKRDVFNTLDAAVYLTDRKPIKEMLLDQDRIAGIGNIYASEALWRAGIRPDRSGDCLTTRELHTLTDAIKGVLKDALARNLDYSGLNVYRKSICPKCGTVIVNTEIKGRSSYWCTSCQS